MGDGDACDTPECNEHGAATGWFGRRCLGHLLSERLGTVTDVSYAKDDSDPMGRTLVETVGVEIGLPPVTPAEVSRMRRDMFAQLERWRALGLIPSEAECEAAYTVHRDPGPAKL